MSAAQNCLIGREAESRALNAGVDAAGEGRGGSILVRGAPGIGKTALLEATSARASAAGFAVLGATGVQSESHLAFAGLHQLLRPVLHDLDRLPPAYSKGLQSAFGLSDEPVSSTHLVAMATLHLLGESVERAPLLLLVDDVQWIDGATIDALAFIARRLEADPILLLCALRDGYDSFLVAARIPELTVDPLKDIHARELLDVRTPDLDPGFRERVLSSAAGNPLALVELAGALGSAGEGVHAFLGAQFPLTTRLERAFGDRLAGLTHETRSFLRVAAADERGLISELMTAASKLANCPITLRVLTEAKATGFLLVDGPEVRFRHPLMRSAIQQATSFEELQATHAALAETLASDPDRSTWHRAAATLGTNDEVANELDAIGRRANRRGAVGVAIEAAYRASQFASDPERQTSLRIRAAMHAWSMGRSNEIHRLLDLIDDAHVPAWHRPDLVMLREAYGRGTWPDAPKVLEFVEAADQVRVQGDLRQGCRLLYKIAERCHGLSPEQEPCKTLISTLNRFPVPDDDPVLLATLALASPIEHGAMILDRLSNLEPGPAGDYRDQPFYLGEAAFALGDFVRAEQLFEPQIQLFRTHGLLGGLAGTLVLQSWVKIQLGDWRSADSMASEAARLADETGQRAWSAVANLTSATLAAYRGETELAQRLATSGEELLPAGSDLLQSSLQWARGAAALATGRYDEAFQNLCHMFDPADPAFNHAVRNWVLPDLVEAAVRSGHESDAARIVDELGRLAPRWGSPQLKAALEYARVALAADGDDADFGVSAELRSYPFTRARLLLAHGAWLRRHRRPADSRAPLRAARDAFDMIGAAPWGERARQELRASGETSRRRTYDLVDALSPQELQIARLAAKGLSNKEIGQQLFVSHRTISTHLYRIFPKLGITARSQLNSALGSPSPHSSTR